MRKTLTNLKDTRDLTDESVEYAIDRTLCLNGVDRKVYHGQCLIGPQIQKLLANRVEIINQLETKFLQVREQNLRKKPNNKLGICCRNRGGKEFLPNHLALLWLRLWPSEEDSKKIYLRRVIWVTRSDWSPEFSVANPALMGEKGRVSDSEVARPLVRSATTINLPWSILPLHGGSDRKTAQDRRAHGCRLLPPARLRGPGGEQEKTGSNR